MKKLILLTSFLSSACFAYPITHYMNTDVGPGVGYESAGSRAIIEAAKNNPEIVGAVVGAVVAGGGSRAVIGAVVGEAVSKCAEPRKMGSDPGGKR